MTDDKTRAGTAASGTAPHVLHGRLRDLFRAHRPDPEDPDRRCLCGYDGESYDDHLAESALRAMEEIGFQTFPVRHSA
jgi:hypothetical protein